MIMGVCLLSAPAIADEKVVLSQDDKDQLEIIAQTLARCGGVYDWSSELRKDTDPAPAPSLSAHEIADGAEISAAFLLMSTGIIPDWQNALKYAASGRSLEKARQEALFAAEPRSFSEKISNNDDGGLSIEKCALLSEIQTELVNKAKIWTSADHVDVDQRVDLQHVVGIPPQSSHQKPNLRKKQSPPAADKSAQPAEPPHTKRKKQYMSRHTYPAYQTYQVARPAPQLRGWYGVIAPYGSFGPPAYSSSGP